MIGLNYLVSLMILFLNTPLEQFTTENLVSIYAPIVADWVFSLTNVGLYAVLSMVLIVGTHFLVLSNLDTTQKYYESTVGLVSTRWFVALETGYATLHSMVKEQIGQRWEEYTPFIYSLFLYLLVGNLAGNVPYSFAFTSSAVVAMGLSLLIFLGVTVLGTMRHKEHFFSFFVPAGTPLMLVPLLSLIELISYVARAFSLGVRLFANIVAGHTLLKILSSFLYPAMTKTWAMAILTLLPIAIFVALVGLEIAVSMIQAYVFTILTCSYIKDAIELH